MVIYWRPEEYLHNIIFLYYVRTQTAKLPCTYKLRLVITGLRRFPDGDSPTGGHPGLLKMREMIQQDNYWPGIIWDINKYVDGCHICPKVKPV